MRISIVTLNYNGSKETLKLLKSLQEQSDKNFEIIVIDNASEEADFAVLQNGINQLIHITTSHVVMIRNSENLGFSGGNNVGIRQAIENGSDWVTFLNNDTWVEREFMERLKAVLGVKNGVVGIPLIEGDKVAYCGKVQWLKPTLEHAYQLTNLPAYQLYAIGGAMAVHRDVFDKIGFLDEKYFLYFEDADFSIRARKAKIPISIFYDSLIYHNISSSTKKLGLPLLLRYHYRNALYFNWKNGPFYIKLLVWPWSLVIAIKQISKLASKYNVDQSKAILVGVMDFYKNKYGKI
mgnify:CR=1 FL=1